MAEIQIAVSKPLILVVDDEAVVRTTIASWLRGARLTPVCVETRSEALRAAQRLHFSAAVLDYRLANGDNGIQLGISLNRKLGVPFLVISGYLDISTAVGAMKSGAIDVIPKPLESDRLLSSLDRALLHQSPRKHQPRGVSSLIDTEAEPLSPRDLNPAAIRWARAVLSVCSASYDPRTVQLWAHAIGLSASTIEETCHLCGVQTHDARDLARFARALAHNRRGSVPLRDHFAVADTRTLTRLFQRAGLSMDEVRVSLRVFLTEQLFISQSANCLREFGHLAANSPLFT